MLKSIMQEVIINKFVCDIYMKLTVLLKRDADITDCLYCLFITIQSVLSAFNYIN
jgi:hypothetical protein